ncbi:MAG: UbiD family decarboxylase [Nitrososphaeria archaeon]
MEDSYRKYIYDLIEKGKVEIIEKSVDKDKDVPRILYYNQETPVLFTKIKNFENTKIVGNLCPKLKNLIDTLNISESELTDKIINFYSNPKKPINIFNEGEWVEKRVDLSKLPIPKYYKKDGGHYITSSIVVCQFPNSDEENLSVHRIMVIGKDFGTIRILPRNLFKILNEKGGKSEVAVIIGVHPAIFLAASLSLDYGVSEYNLANSFFNGKLRLVRTENGIKVPMGSEVILLGEIDLKQRSKEGPFTDITGTYDIVREEPIIKFTKMLIPREEDIIFHALLPASNEHKLFMGLPQKIKIINVLRKKGVNFKKVNLTNGGCAYFHCIISIKKTNEEDGKNTIKYIFENVHSIKLVIVVDEDIDPYKIEEVEWAIATRFQADKGLVILRDQHGSSLDPSTFKTGKTSKMGIDATLPLNAKKSNFKRAQINE